MQHEYLKLPYIRSNTDQQETEHNSASNVLLDSLYFKDKGSHFSSVTVEIQRFLAGGTIDMGVDIIIMGGDLFYKVATVTRLRK